MTNWKDTFGSLEEMADTVVKVLREMDAVKPAVHSQPAQKKALSLQLGKQKPEESPESIEHHAQNILAHIHAQWTTHAGLAGTAKDAREPDPILVEAPPWLVAFTAEWGRRSGKENRWDIFRRTNVEGPLAGELQAAARAEPSGSFDPVSQHDARDKVLREIVRRRGQQKFREKLLSLYQGRCAITGCTIEAILEAAHVTPYLGPETNKAGNGLLLRADVHTLWDLGLAAIQPKTMKIWMSSNLAGSEYEQYDGREPNLPLKNADHPSAEALAAQWKLTQPLDTSNIS